MGSNKITILFHEKSLDELSSSDQSCIQSAKIALDQAYAPYSGFKVGCAVALTDGSIVTGNNQENAAYPSGLCAERVAIFSARSSSSIDIELIVVLAESTKGESANAFSCGNCRQVMLEYASRQSQPIRILMQTDRDTFLEVADVKELLPFHFNSDSLQ